MSSYYHSISSAAAAPSSGDRGHQQQPRHHRQPRPQLARQLELVRCCRCSLLPADTLPTLILSVLAAAVCGCCLAGQRTPLLGCTAAIRDTAAADSALPHPVCPHCHGAGHTAAPLVSDAGAGEPGARSQEPGSCVAAWCGGVCYNRWCAGQSATVCHHQPAAACLAGSLGWLVAVLLLAGASIPVRHRLRSSPHHHSDHMQ